ncbi:MAG: tRNA lysidine(34) synthetase TilS, partial [Gammaproteobacteria bacterium]|nr:tRNA lysidine(34) synthetase TilS [Gammaproteobacteria bacterium]
LHPHSARWALHCRRVAGSLGVPITVRTAEVRRSRGESPEAVARIARYALLEEALAEDEALLTAHTQDDQLETVLLQLLRGAGVAGLAAMPDVACLADARLVRPLLPVPRAALRDWLSAQRLRWARDGTPAWVEDESNSFLSFDRNFLRLRVLPAVAERWPQAAATVSRSARHAAEAQRLLDALGEADVARAACGEQLSAKALRALTPDRRRNALRYWITARGYQAPPSTRLEEIAGPLLAAREDAQPHVAWQGAVVQRQADLLCVHAPEAVATATEVANTAAASAARRNAGLALAVSWNWRESDSCALPAPFGTLRLVREARGPLDLEALEALGSVLTVRPRQGGERLRPGRGAARRTLKNLLQEARVPLALRMRLPLIFAGDRLIAVAGLWVDEAVQASAASAQRARLLWSDSRMC